MEVFKMNENHNNSIGCVVNECRFHSKNENYCTLEKIQVTKHESMAKTKQCTDCGSFEKE
jgi:hypothetical protein